jgi:hypothetical protein
LVSSLYPNEAHNPGYGQLYIFDSAEATTKRLENQSNQGCMVEVMQQLDEMLRQVNPFAESHKQMHHITQANPTMNVCTVFMEDLDLDKRSYNAPTSRTEVAAVFVGEDGEPPTNRDISTYPTGDCCRCIVLLNKNGDPMVYLLLFLCREVGWRKELKHIEERRTTRRVRLTHLQIFAYRLALRPGFSLIHSSGKLFQQYVVDVYVKTEGSRLNYLRHNQKDL